MRPPTGPESEHPASCIHPTSCNSSLNSVCSIALLIFFIFTLARQAAAAEISPESLLAGIRAGNIVQVRRALSSGISARAMDRDGTPALMTAVLYGDAAIVKLLLDRGADPNATNRAGATALMWAIPNLPEVELLVARGAKVNVNSTDLGRTPLLVAASYPHTAKVLRVLLRRGADIEAKDKEGLHGLGRAALYADVETVRFLVENGSNLSDRSGFGEFGLGLYLTRQDIQIPEFLLSRGVRAGKEALAVARNAQSVALLDRVLAAGAEVNASIPALKSTPLLMATAAERTRLDALRWLLDKGADPNAEGIDGDRALDWAVYRADKSRMELLRRFGAKAGAGTRAVPFTTPEGANESRAALERSVGLLLSAAPAVFKTRGCVSCHHQLLPLQVSALASRIEPELLQVCLFAPIRDRYRGK
jgi:uncharacterized protein